MLASVVTDFQRARQPDQKEKRRAHVVATARAMLGEGGDLDALTLNELARRTGMAKSNIYRYFETREAVLLSVMWEEWVAWYEHLSSSYRRPANGRSAFDSLVRHLARTLAARPLLCALLTALPAVLERNLSEETIRFVKTKSLESFREIGRFLESKVPDLSAQQYAELLHDTVCTVAGLHPVAFPSPVAANVLAALEFSLFRKDLTRDLERMLLALARFRRDSEP